MTEWQIAMQNLQKMKLDIYDPRFCRSCGVGLGIQKPGQRRIFCSKKCSQKFYRDQERERNKESKCQ